MLQGKSYSYCIEQVLGQGSFGITYLASVKMQGALGSIDAKVKVAVKEFFMKEINGREGTTVTSGSKGGLFADYRKKFVREATNLSKLQHPNIIKVLECFEANNTVYYTMEYLEDGSLDELISRKHGLSEAEAVNLACQIAKALSYMHEHKVLHLDLKPGNIMLSNGNAVLIDFGLSKQYDVSGNPESSTTVGAGTPGYAPIEQSSYRDGKGFPVTMDIYALGATMYKMLTGERPPDASDVLNDGLPDKPASVSSEVWAAVEAAMEPMRKNRPQTVGAWVNILPEVSEIFSNLEVEIVDVENSARNMHNGHEWVDLGLSVKWATCNIGADNPEEYGDKFAWGEIDSMSSGKENKDKTRYVYLGNIAGNPQHDAARAKWGGIWRLPSKMEFEELIAKCDWKWTIQGDLEGYCVTSRVNGNSIFLPAEKNHYRYNRYNHGGYWSSIPHDSHDEYACCLDFDSSHCYVDWHDRCFGVLSIRPVIGLKESYEWVDLGLSVKWATCNIGADKPEDYGDYFAWGEIATKPSYTFDNCKTWERSIGDIEGNSQYDAARAKWGSPWRLPTDAEFEELIDKCNWKWTKEGGHAGYRVTSKINGNSIFLPAAGFRYGTSHYYVGEYGRYWGSTPNEGNAQLACNLCFYSSSHSVDWYYRYHGRSVRPVSD